MFIIQTAGVANVEVTLSLSSVESITSVSGAAQTSFSLWRLQRHELICDMGLKDVWFIVCLDFEHIASTDCAVKRYLNTTCAPEPAAPVWPGLAVRGRLDPDPGYILETPGLHRGTVSTWQLSETKFMVSESESEFLHCPTDEHVCSTAGRQNITENNNNRKK